MRKKSNDDYFAGTSKWEWYLPSPERLRPTKFNPRRTEGREYEGMVSRNPSCEGTGRETCTMPPSFSVT